MSPRPNPFHKPLLILPFDHRSSFARDILGYSGELTAKQKQEVKALKSMVFDAFTQAIKHEKHPQWFGVLIDEEYGAPLLRKAKRMGVSVSVTTEQSGQKEYHFEYGNAFLQHLDRFEPAYAKALVRYHPADKALNKRQLARLKKLSTACHKHGYGLLFELLVPGEKADMQKARLVAQSIREIKKQVNVDVWKLEGLSREGWKIVLKAIGHGPRVIVLGRGLGKAGVRKWLVDAAHFEQVIGFAVGRTIFAKPLEAYVSKRATRAEAVERIATGFANFVKLWKKLKQL